MLFAGFEYKLYEGITTIVLAAVNKRDNYYIVSFCYT